MLLNFKRIIIGFSILSFCLYGIIKYNHTLLFINDGQRLLDTKNNTLTLPLDYNSLNYHKEEKKILNKISDLDNNDNNIKKNNKILDQSTDELDQSINEQNLYISLKNYFLNLTTEKNIDFSFNLFQIAKCSMCVQLIKGQLLSNFLTDIQLQKLTKLLSKENRSELAIMLVDVANNIIKQNGFNQRSAIFIPAIINFNSFETAQQFTGYLLANSQIPFELEDALIKSINNTDERQQVTVSLLDRFTATADLSEREKILSIAQPESLVKIAVMAMEQGNENLYAQASNYLTITPSPFTFDALLGMIQAQSYDIDRQANIIELSHQWAYHQLSGSRLDVIEERLGSDSLSEQDKQVTLGMLQHSEDQIRSREIIAKYFENN